MSVIDAALLWARTIRNRAVRALLLLTPIERIALLLAVLHLALLARFLFDYRDLAHWLLTGAFLSTVVCVVLVILDALLQRAHAKRLGSTLLMLNSAKPTGAPRVANVRCRHGDMHRFVYGPTGWEPAGPAPDVQPAPQEVPAT